MLTASISTARSWNGTQTICYSQTAPAGKLVDRLRTDNPEIVIPLAAAFDLNS